MLSSFGQVKEIQIHIFYITEYDTDKNIAAFLQLFLLWTFLSFLFNYTDFLRRGQHLLSGA